MSSMADLIDLDERSVQSSSSSHSSGSADSSVTQQSSFSGGTVSDGAEIADLIQEAIEEIEIVIKEHDDTTNEGGTSNTLRRVLLCLKSIDLTSMRTGTSAIINGNALEDKFEHLKNQEWPSVNRRKGLRTSKQGSAPGLGSDDESDQDDSGQPRAESANAGTKRRKVSITKQKKLKRVKSGCAENGKDDDEEPLQDVNEPNFQAGADEEECEDKYGPREQTAKKEVCDTIKKYTDLTKAFKGKVIIHMEDKVKIVEYGGRRRDDKDVQMTLMCLEQKSGRLNFTKTMVIGRHWKQLGMVPSKYKSMAGRIRKMMEIDPALLLVFYDEPSMIVALNDSMITLFKMWYDEHEQKDLLVKKYGKSVRDFLSAFACGKEDRLEEILAMWRKGMYN
ncbi:hypothetical protein HK104_010854 [Borealophlyctis nickersoniae]|nr:hypothetical protein HK104_010854 [Borealophlyctis nickersoniae]